MLPSSLAERSGQPALPPPGRARPEPTERSMGKQSQVIQTIPFRNKWGYGETSVSAQPALSEILDLVESQKCLSVLKEGGARKVWLAESSLGILCVKDYHCPTLLDGWRARIRGSRAHREWRRMTRFAAAGVPVPTPVLWVERKDAAAAAISTVVSVFETGCVTLGEVLARRSELSNRKRIQVGERVGEAIARMHQAGGRHDDLHAGNLLVQLESEDPRVFIVDLHKVALKKGLPWNRRLRNLARLLGGVERFLTLPDKQRCLRAYLRVLPGWNPPFSSEREARRSMGRAVEAFARKDFGQQWRRRVKKCTEEGKRFRRVKAGEYTGWIRTGWNTAGLREALRDPNAWLQSGACRIVKNTPSTTVARATVPDLSDPLFVKRYNRKSLWERTKNLFRRSRSMRVWRAGYALELLGIPTPETVCALEKRKGPLLLEAFVVTRWVEGGIGFDDFYRERCAPSASDPLDPKSRRNLEKEVARLFRALHGNRISHGDLKGRNILLDPSTEAPFSPQFVDLDAVSLAPIRFRRSRVNDLSRLLFSVYPVPSLCRRIRFFREYARGNPDLWAERRRWWRSIEKRTLRKLREKRLLNLKSH